jgi:hypothetical protein
VFELVRIFGRPLGLLALVGSCASAANASSFVEVSEPHSGATPSILMLGPTAVPVDVVTLPALATDPNVAIGEVDPAPPHNVDPADSSIVTLSRSVIAFGEPDVVDEKVGAIGEQPWHRDPMPMVIRGGILGDAYVSPPPPATAETPKAPDQQASQSAESPSEPGKTEQAAPPSAQATPAPYAPKPE